jgi:hypothetical protein
VIAEARAEAAVTAGYAVILGTDPVAPQVLPVTDGIAGGVFGIVLAGDSETDAFVANEEVNVLRRGSAYVTCAANWTAGNQVYALDATGAVTSSATNATALPSARFLNSGSAGAVAKIELDALGAQGP